MAKFDFFEDQKVTVWERVNFSIEAETKEEAIEKLKKQKRKAHLITESNDIDIVNIITLCESSEPLSLEANDGKNTIEVYCNNDLIWENSLENN